MKTNCVITGTGVTSPFGAGIEPLWESFERHRSNGDTDAPPAQCAPELFEGINRRLRRKLDRFTLLALAASQGALADARVADDEDYTRNTGVILGNSCAGWDYVIPTMYEIYNKDITQVNSYVATAWFPAAPQGEISILLGLGGYSKTIAAGRISAGAALEHAAMVLERGRCPSFLVGGSEAPVNDMVSNAFARHAGQRNPLAEGAAVVTLESEDTARRRGANVVAEVAAVKRRPTLEQALGELIGDGELAPDTVDCVMYSDGNGEADECRAALARVFECRPRMQAWNGDRLLGDSLAASYATYLALGCEALRRSRPLPGTRALHGGAMDPHGPQSVLVCAVEPAGQAMVTLLRRPPRAVGDVH